MNIGQIRRFVNDSLIPLNRLIGSPEDDASKNTLFGIQKNAYIWWRWCKARLQRDNL